MPLYYTGLTQKATVAFEDNQDTAQVLTLSREYYIEVTVGKYPFSQCYNSENFKRILECSLPKFY